MPKAADIGSKRLISLAPTAWVRWLLDDPTLEAIDILSADFQWVSRESDALLRVRSPQAGEFLMLNEIQLYYRGDEPRRIRAYAGLAEERYRLPVFPVLINIMEPGAGVKIERRYHSEFLGLTAHQDFRVLNLWEIEASTVISQNLLPLLPLTPTLRGGADENLLRQAVTQLRADESLAEMESLLAFFASFVLDTNLVRQIMRWDMAILRESPWYTQILNEGFAIGLEQGIEKGLEQGIEKGLEQGIEKGLEQGIEKGRRETALQQLVKILAHRFGAVPEELERSLSRLPLDQLMDLLNPALDANSLEEFRQHIPSYALSDN